MSLSNFDLPSFGGPASRVSLIGFLFGKGLSKEDVLKTIADDETINDLVRQRATELAGPFADNLARAKTQSVVQPPTTP